jgi:signal transduction histidine kinase
LHGNLPDSVPSPILDALPVAVIQVTPDGRVCYSNERASALLASAGDPLGNSPIASVLAPLATLDAARPALGRDRAQLRLPGSDRTIGLQTSTLPDGSRVVVFQDITRFEETRLERDRLLQMASVSDVMPAVLHELKNPLAGISAALELLVEDAADSDHQQRLHAILVEVRRLSLTIDGLGRFRHEVASERSVAIDVALREAFALLEPQARSRGIEAVLDVADMPLLPFEAAAIRAVVFNLVTNSLHACTQGARLELHGHFDRAREALTVRVRDTGAGMKPEVLGRCTELFFTTKPRGSGIGLALCKGVAEAVGGTMTVESTWGSGTTVSLELPIQGRRLNVANR